MIPFRCMEVYGQMRVKILYETPHFPCHIAARTVDDRLVMFLRSPYRAVTEADFIPMPNYQATGENALEAGRYLYTAYHLEKEDENNG